MTGGPKVRCNVCGVVIQSLHRHDFQVCDCDPTPDGTGSQIFVDGGDDYFRMGFCKDADYTVLDEENEDARD